MHPLVLLAKLAVENYIKNGKIIDSFEGLPEESLKEFSKERSGVFVTIEQSENNKKALRGCIGTYLPIQDNVLKEVIYNAISAATEDYRFYPIKKEELPFLFYTVYILSKPEEVKNLKELNPKKYGIIVKTVPINKGGDVVFNGHMALKSGLLLPDLPGVDTVEKQISICCRKGGIDPEKEKIVIYKFTVKKYN